MTDNIVVQKLSNSLISSVVEQLVELDQSVFGEADYWKKESFLMELPGKFQFSFLLQKDNLIVGYLIVSKKNSDFHIHRLVVNGQFQRLGMARKLLSSLLPLAEGTSITLKVDVSNINAVVFYIRNRFKFSSRVGQYYLMTHDVE